jgi:branched-chain amino acid transport system substrate-binding protein
MTTTAARWRLALLVLVPLVGACAVAEQPAGQLATRAPAAATPVNASVGAAGGTGVAGGAGADAATASAAGTSSVTGAAAATASTLAAGSGLSGPATNAGGSDTSDVGVSATSIKIGAILPLSGPIGPYGKPWLEALQTPLRYANDHGLVNGRRIELIACDDAFQGDRALACAKKLVEQDQVFMVLNPGSAAGSPAALPYLISKGVPSGSALGYNPDEFTSPLVFPMTASGTTQGHMGAMFMAKHLSVKRAGMIVLGNVQAATVTAAAFQAATAKFGIALVATASINFQDADCSAQMLQMQAKAPESVFFATDSSTAIKCFTAANTLGYKPPKQFVSPIPQYINLVPQYGGQSAEGSYVMTVNNTPDTANNSFIQEYLQRTSAYYPDHQWWSETPAFYAGAQLSVDALRSLGRNVTRQRFVDVMNTAVNAFPGLGVDITYRAGPHDPNREAEMLQLQGSSFVPVTGFERDPLVG